MASLLPKNNNRQEGLREKKSVNLAVLRQKAQELIADKQVDLSEFSRDDLAFLVEELQIHQVELEIQNEELRDTQMRLSAEKDRFQNLYDFAPNGYCTIDAYKTIKDCNHTFAKMVGRARPAVIGSKFSDYVSHESQDDFYHFHRKVVSNKTTVSTGVALVCDLSSTLLNVQLSAMVHGKNEEVEYLLAVTDISELRQTERDLASRLGQQSSVAQLGRVALSTTDINDFFVEVTQTIRKTLKSNFCTILQIDPATQNLTAIAGDGWPTLFASVEVRTHSAYTLKLDNATIIDEFKSDQRLLSIENRISGRPLSGVCVVIKVDDQQWGTLSVHDHTLDKFNEDDIRYLESIANILSLAIQRRKMEDAMLETQKLNSVGLLAGGVAHDFNNLLTGLVIQSNLALDELAPSHPSRPRIQKINNSAEQAANLTRQLLAYAGKGQFHLQSFNVNQLITDNINLIQASIPTSIKITTDLAGSLPNIAADKGQIQQIVMNLVINAAEAYDESAGEVQVKTTAHTQFPHHQFTYLSSPPQQAHTYVQITVSDTGKGMERETVHKIFDPFFSTKFTGRGLGLAAVQGIIRQIDGIIAVNSTPSHGTTFHIFIPTTDIAESLPPTDSLPPTAQLDSKCILHIDDDIDIREGISEYLSMFGYKVLEANDGQEGIDVFKQHQKYINLVLLDLTMPNMTGDEAFLKLRKISPDVPIIIMSGYGEKEVIQRLQGERFRFFQKPFSLAGLVKIIGNEIEKESVKVI